jgi:hypothetical protein
VIYRNNLHRDLLIRILRDGGISIAAAISQSDFGAASLQTIDADVIVFEDAETEEFQSAVQTILFSPTPVLAKRVIGLGRGYLVNVAFQKEVVPDAGIEDLVERVRPAPIEADGMLSRVSPSPNGHDGPATPGLPDERWSSESEPQGDYPHAGSFR